MQSPGQLADLVQALPEQVVGPLQLGPGCPEVRAQEGAHRVELEGDSDESLLCAVVQVALEPAALLALGDDFGQTAP